MWGYRSNTENALHIIMSFVSLVFALIMIVMVVFTTIALKAEDQYGSKIFGYRFLIVLSNSMTETDKNTDIDIHFSAGDVVVTKELSDEEKKELKEGDVIAFVSSNADSYGKVVTHMIRAVEHDSDGNVIGFTTFGTATNTNDGAVARIDDVLGKYSFSIPKVGELFSYVRTPAGYLSCIFLPFVILICWYGLKMFRAMREL